MNNGHDSQDQASSYLRYLPAIYHRDPFLGRFLRIFEDVLSPIQEMVSTLPGRFDPGLAPSPMLEFLATWVGERRQATLSDGPWRKLIKQALELHRWRGTKRGLRLALELATGRRPLVTEYGKGMVLGEDSSLGLNTPLEDGMAPHVNVTFTCKPEDVDKAVVDDVISRCSPGHVSYSVTFQP